VKKIIDGIRYNTEIATAIGTWSTGGSTSDFSYAEATLYVTPKSGRFFIAGHGGPMSRFAQSAGQNQMGSGSDLIPFEDASEAYAWAEAHLEPEEFEPYFEDLIEDA